MFLKSLIVLFCMGFLFILGGIGLDMIARSAGETIILRASERNTRLWVADVGGYAWILGRPGTGWYDRARSAPIVTVVRDDVAVTRRANVVNTLAARASISGAMALKYGFGNMALFYGKDVVPIRLDPIQP